MSILAQDVESQVRKDVSDTLVPYRWDAPTILGHITTGRNEIVRQRPDALYSGQDIITTQVDDLPPISALTGTGSNTLISRMFFNALVHYVDYCILTGDSEDANNQKLAADHWDKFVKEIG